MAGVGNEYRFRDDATGTEHLVEVDEDGGITDDKMLCGRTADNAVYATLEERTIGGSSVYDYLDNNSFTCEYCREELLDRLGLPETAEEANEQVGREVF